MNWIGSAWIFWEKARYRYVSEVIFCILALLFLYEVIKYFLHSNPGKGGKIPNMCYSRGRTTQGSPYDV